MGARLALAVTMVVLGLAAAPSGASAGMLAFTSTRCAGAEENTYAGGDCPDSIWLANDDGTGLRRLTGATRPQPDGGQAPPDIDNYPSWSSAGDAVLFRHVDASSKTFSFQIRPVDGGPGTQFGPSVPILSWRHFMHPQWSPDGQSVLFLDPVAETGWMGQFSHISLMTADGAIRDVTPKTPPYYDDAQFSRDGKRIIARTFGDGTQAAQGQTTLVSMNLDGSDPRPIFVANRPDQVFGNIVEYAVSPDGASIGLHNAAQLFVLTPTTGIVGQIPGAEVHFSPNRLAFADEPSPRLIRGSDSTMGVHGMGIETTDVASGATSTLIAPDPYVNYLTREEHSDNDPAWHASRPVVPVPDATAPVVQLAVPKPARTSSRGRRRASVAYPRTQRDAVVFRAFDTSGIRLEASIQQVTRVHGRDRCRALGLRWFGKAQSCARRRWRHVDSSGALSTTMSRLPAGRFRLRLRARDAYGRRGAERGVRFSLPAVPKPKQRGKVRR